MLGRAWTPVRAAGWHGSPTQRTERDSFATMYEDRLTQLRARGGSSGVSADSMT